MIYAAYGSNISTERLLQRIPNAKYLGVVKLNNWKIVFNKIMIEDGGSGKANIIKTNNINDYVYLGLYEVTEEEMKTLDWFEGVDDGDYYRKELECENKKFIVYLAGDKFIRENLKPFSWYLFHIIYGILSNKDVPKIYLEQFKDVKVLGDNNLGRLYRNNICYEPLNQLKSFKLKLINLITKYL